MNLAHRKPEINTTVHAGAIGKGIVVYVFVEFPVVTRGEVKIKVRISLAPTCAG
jgi:hypothetical protein